MSLTERQQKVIESLGFRVPETLTEVWNVGAFSTHNQNVIVRGVPYLPEVNEILRAVGFRWDAEKKEWRGKDETEAQVEILKAFNWCASRHYPAGRFPQFAIFTGGRVAVGRPTSDGQPPATGGSPCCPVRVGAYEYEETD